MNHPESYPDQRIDQLLHAFATTATPNGLEQRISARVAQRAAEALERKPSRFARLAYTKLQPFAIATTALVALAATCLLFITHTQQQQIVQQTSPIALPQHQTSPVATARTSPHPSAMSQQPRAAATSTTASPAQNDPDAIALAETLAPSHPVPPLPLTWQEALLLRSTRPGQPIEVAELDTLRESALTAIAATHERTNLREYVHSLLGPLAAAQALTPSSPPPDVQPVTSAEPPSQ